VLDIVIDLVKPWNNTRSTWEDHSWA